MLIYQKTDLYSKSNLQRMNKSMFKSYLARAISIYASDLLWTGKYITIINQINGRY
jgi:hypothetical protein